MSYLPALEAGIGRVSSSGGVSLEVILGSIPLVPIGVLPSVEVIAPVIPSVVSSGRRPIPIDIHWNGGVVHPPRGIG